MSLRILAVEGDADFAHALVLVTREVGHELRVAANWIDALPLVHSWKPHILLLDIDVPDVDANELSVFIKWMTEARVILYSARPLGDSLRSELRANCDSLLGKDRLFQFLGKLPRVRDTRVIRRPSSERLRANVVGVFDATSTLAEVLTGIEFNRKTGVLSARADTGEDATLVFREGSPVSCSFAGLAGRDAVLALLAAPSGRFVVNLKEVADERSMHESFTRLIFDHLRRTDESSRVSAVVE